jgi:hypothetical protein
MDESLKPDGTRMTPDEYRAFYLQKYGKDPYEDPPRDTRTFAEREHARRADHHIRFGGKNRHERRAEAARARRGSA